MKTLFILCGVTSACGTDRSVDLHKAQELNFIYKYQ